MLRHVLIDSTDATERVPSSFPESAANQIDNVAYFVDPEEKRASKKDGGRDRNYEQDTKNFLPLRQVRAGIKHRFEREPANACEQRERNYEFGDQAQNRASLKRPGVFSHQYV